MPRLQKDAALIEQTIPALVNGVSRQATHARRDSQCEEQENILSTVAEGIVRRPPTEHIWRLGDPKIPGDFTFANSAVDVDTDTIVLNEFVFDTTGEFGPVQFGPSAAMFSGIADLTSTWINVVSPTSFQILTGQGGNVVDLVDQGTGTDDVTCYTTGPNVAGSVVDTFAAEYTNPPSPLALAEGAHFSVINRGEDEQFLVVVTDGDIKVYDAATGAAMVVNDNSPGSPGSYTGLSLIHPNETTYTDDTLAASIIAQNDPVQRANHVYLGMIGSAFFSDTLEVGDAIKVRNDTAGVGPFPFIVTAVGGGGGFIFLQSTDEIDHADMIGANVVVTATYPDPQPLQAAKHFETISVADYTFVVNKTLPLAMTGFADNERTNPMECLIGVKEGATSGYYNRLRLTIGTATMLSNTTNGTSSDLMMDNFCWELTGGNTNPDNTVGSASQGNGEFSDWTWTRLNRTTLHGYKSSNLYGDFDLDTEDLYGDTIHTLMTTTVSGQDPSILKFSDAPAEALEGFTIEVQGDEGNTADNFYIKYDAERRSWVETVKPGLNSTFDANSFPHALVFNQTTREFSYEIVDWATREAGDDVTAPVPTGIGSTVNDLFIHEGRLCLLTGENVLMSEAGDYFNFWPTTVTTLVDSDPIDVAGTGNRVAIWDYAVQARQQVLLYSSVGDLVSTIIGGNNDTLSVKNARIKVLGEWSHSRLRPQTLGTTVYYALDRGGSSSINAMKEIEVELWNADEVTAHIPGYLPVGLTDAHTSQAEQIIVYRAEDEPNNLYIYAAEEVGAQQVLSSWSRWSLAAGDTILSTQWVESILYLVVERADGVHLEKMDFGKLDEELGLGANPMGHRVYLDSLVTVTGEYDVNTDQTDWTLPYDTGTDEFQVVRGQEWGDDRGLSLAVTGTAGAVVSATGDYSAFPVFVGKSFTSTYQMSQILKRNAEGFGELNGRLQLRRGRVAYAKTGAFDVVVSSTEDDNVSTVPFTPVVSGGSLLGAVALSDGTFPFPIGGKNTDVRVTFQSSSFLPFQLSSVNWEGRFYKTAQ